MVEFATPPQGPYDGSYFINSGTLEEGESFSVTFSRVGTYPYVCLLHREMVGSVEVVASGAPDVTTQQDVDQYVLAEATRWEAQTAEILATRGRAVRLDGAHGEDLWFVRVGAEWRSEPDGRVGRLTLRAFLPDKLTIRQGDTVVWYADSRVNAHTVTFPIQGQLPPSRYVPRLADGALAPLEMLTPRGSYRGPPDSFDWPRIVEDQPVIATSRPGALYDPTQYFSSGRLSEADAPVGKAWALTFGNPGTFQYLCIPHANVGMLGQITVLAP